MSKEEQREHWEEVGYDIDLECACNKCQEWANTCAYAWDLYNINCEAGIDCLASK